MQNKYNDTVRSPNHYEIFPEYGLEVKDITKRFLENIEKSGADVNLFEASWLTQSLQYFLRFYAKNGVEDLEKCKETLEYVIESMVDREGKNV